MVRHICVKELTLYVRPKSQLRTANAHPHPEQTICDKLPDCLRMCSKLCLFPPLGCSDDSSEVCTVDFVPDQVTMVSD